MDSDTRQTRQTTNSFAASNASAQTDDPFKKPYLPSGPNSRVGCHHLTPTFHCPRGQGYSAGSVLTGPLFVIGSNGSSRTYTPNANITDGGSLACANGDGGGDLFLFKNKDGSQVEFTKGDSGWWALGNLSSMGWVPSDPLDKGTLVRPERRL